MLRVETVEKKNSYLCRWLQLNSTKLYVKSNKLHLSFSSLKNEFKVSTKDYYSNGTSKTRG